MWSRVSSSQRTFRRVVGGAAVVAALVLPWTSDGPGHPAVLLGHVSDVASSVLDDSRRFIEVDFGEIDPNRLRNDYASDLSGTVVYAENADGTGVIIGSMVRYGDGYAVALRPDVADQYRGRADLLYAPPVENFRQGLAVLCAPEGPEGEMLRAQESLMPVVRERLLTPLETRLRAELEVLLNELPERHGDQIDAVVESLRKAMQPEIADLTGKLGAAAWDEIGVWGVAEGVGRKTLNAGEAAWDWTKRTVGGLFGEGGEPDPNDTRRPRDFLTEDRKQKIADAVLVEAKKFWAENQTTLIKKFSDTLRAHEKGFLNRVESEWLPQLYEKVVVATWNEHGSVVEAALSHYASDFAQRRLVGADGSTPTLALAYAVRSATGVTGRPLFVVKMRASADSEAPMRLLPYAIHRESIRR